jgi:hypothetical protein
MRDPIFSTELPDWRADWFDRHDCHHVSILVPIGGSLEEDDEDGRGIYGHLENNLRRVTGSSSLHVGHIDPYVGAGGYGIGAIWEVIGRGADLFAWITAALAITPGLRRGAKYLAERFGSSGSPATVYLSREAIEVLSIADLCYSRGVDPRRITDLQVLEHKYPPLEPAIELQQLYSAYTVTAAGVGPDHYYHVWSYFVTCRGQLISFNEVEIPVPNATHWPARKDSDEYLGEELPD